MISRINHKLAHAKRPEGGFTLIEMLVVIIILGILAAAVVFAVRGTGDKGSSSAYATDAKTVRTAQEAYCAKFGRYGSEAELVNEKFLSDTSRYHNVEFTAGACNGAGVASQSGFKLTCDANETGCGAAGAEPKTGVLVVNLGTTPPAATINPAVTSEGGTHSASEDMFNGLLRYELDGSVGGDLAQSFNIDNTVPSGSNPNCAAATCDPITTVATFTLREGVVFHGKDASVLGDGTILSPADVEFSFEKAILAAHGRTRAINPALGVTGQNQTTAVPVDAIQTQAAVPGTHGGIVTFNFRQVFAPLKYTLNVTEAPIISKTAYEPCWNAGTLFSGTPCGANTSPVGTGPFRFKSLDSSGVRTVKNPDYFRFDGANRLPYFNEVFKMVVPGNAAVSLESGEVDVAGISNADRPSLASNPKFVLTTTPRGSGGGNCITTISFNTTKRAIAGTHANAAGTVANLPPGGTPAIGQPPPNGYPADSPYFGQNKAGSNTNASPHKILGDPAVREAIFKSLDRSKILTDVLFNGGRVADAPLHSIFQPDGAYQGPQPLPTFDRAAANTMLDAAGWNGARTTANGQSNIRTALNHPNKANADPQLVVADGTPLSLEYLASTGNETFSAEVRSQLQTVGIDVVRVHGNNASVVAPRIFHGRTYDMAQISYCNNDEPQFGVRRQYHTDQLIQTNAFTNASGYKSTMMDALWLEASKAPDVPTYQDKFLRIQRLALGLDTVNGMGTTTAGALEIAQRVPMVQVVESAGTRAYRAQCSGFNHNNTGLYYEGAQCSDLT